MTWKVGVQAEDPLGGEKHETCPDEMEALLRGPSSPPPPTRKAHPNNSEENSIDDEKEQQQQKQAQKQPTLANEDTIDNHPSTTNRLPSAGLKELPARFERCEIDDLIELIGMSSFSCLFSKLLESPHFHILGRRDLPGKASKIEEYLVIGDQDALNDLLLSIDKRNKAIESITD
ncbi:hypothetical protein PtA15_8A472 [Puccinia triticina]|uniref:Uncharacterized protein n=1 Tax=Puccinia triticina TaxID=208348 RepID=A0ABY7CT92_9BASI|nr:uncharacterized protein PtA15_8A472 [Puccinia triticina]WAQ87568.1 hypothetical protein PtA15_8A472 [Puccinia triticina]